MSKQYYLYLDESGDFDKDLLENWKNECLVGGLLVEGNTGLTENDAKSILIRAWKKVFPEGSRISENEMLKKIRHSTELDEKKAKLVTEVLSGAEKYGEFIIFENFKKTKIINSTVTYVNIMADGIIQLLGRLALENTNETIRLHVIAGFRKDTTGTVSNDSITGYIDKEECVNRIQERMALLRVKNNQILARKSTVSFEYCDDKRTMSLILADYICNFYYTNIARIYREEYKDGITYKEFLMEKYHGNNIFSLNGNNERERLMSYLNVQEYGTALYEAGVGLIKQKENINSLIQAFSQLPELIQINHLQSFDNYINNIVAVERRLDDETIRNIERSLDIIKKIGETGGIDVTVNCFSMLLYQLAIYNHRGDLYHMDLLFEECKTLVGKVASRTENINYLFMFYNRYAIFLIDDFRVQEAYELLEQVKDAFEGMELAISSFPYQSESDSDRSITSEQLGKILGTQAQCCRYMLSIQKMGYERAAEVSDGAIKNFIIDRDKKRQYQYRAQIEIEAGHYEQAWKYLLDGCGCSSAGDFFDENKDDPFALYHLSAFVKRFAGEGQYHEEMKNLIRRYEKKYKKSDCLDFPVFLTMGNLAEAMAKAGYEKEKIKSYYMKAIGITDEMQPLFKVLKLCIHAGYASWLLKNHDGGASVQLERIDEACNGMSEEEKKLSNGAANMIDRLRFIISEGADADELLEYSKLRQY